MTQQCPKTLAIALPLETHRRLRRVLADHSVTAQSFFLPIVEQKIEELEQRQPKVNAIAS